MGVSFFPIASFHSNNKLRLATETFHSTIRRLNCPLCKFFSFINYLSCIQRESCQQGRDFKRVYKLFFLLCNNMSPKSKRMCSESNISKRSSYAFFFLWTLHIIFHFSTKNLTDLHNLLNTSKLRRMHEKTRAINRL